MHSRLPIPHFSKPLRWRALWSRPATTSTSTSTPTSSSSSSPSSSAPLAATVSRSSAATAASSSTSAASSTDDLALRQQDSARSVLCSYERAEEGPRKGEAGALNLDGVEGVVVAVREVGVGGDGEAGSRGGD
ncbi:uncharacterized protein K452DRAFT_55057 [Aplosporella prunicola CBS 121167]|uniref:Uncharacterized protein n=1 Tax=Aplosporella prunicola CBS 121167 TaxID=1176127 RepID=A0A6A6BAJ9_9PEZI|nr:uncharacterized protein K452DRAFT_55057 [Aplosporella prunicola CBS 121167]KAF2140383.1 hypothetical protein K452DRAFT_55057 [Aplosporella prunicola CBS 121167]